jgi:hypothetical protein
MLGGIDITDQARAAFTFDAHLAGRDQKKPAPSRDGDKQLLWRFWLGQ